MEGGHHGGAWKVAYADFVTAMMAFFLLMWLLNATTEEQRRGIADYFSPHANISNATSGFGLPFGGRTPNSVGALASDRGAVRVLPAGRPLDAPEDEEEVPEPAENVARARPEGGAARPVEEKGRAGARAVTGADAAGVAEDRMAVAGVARPLTGTGGRAAAGVAQGGEADAPGAAERGAREEGARPAEARTGGAAALTDAEIQRQVERQERAAFERVAQQLRDEVRADPALSQIARQLMIDITPEGLRLQLVDEDRLPMFMTGSAGPSERARAMLAKIAPVLARLPQSISITGHTDAAPYRGAERSNWELSAERANATRRIMLEAGLPEGRVRSVAGVADRDPLVSGDPMAASNRRIAIVVLRETPAAAK